MDRVADLSEEVIFVLSLMGFQILTTGLAIIGGRAVSPSPKLR